MISWRRVFSHREPSVPADAGTLDSTLASCGALETAPEMLFPIAHYYSPFYDVRELAARREVIWPSTPRLALDLDWQAEAQLRLCTEVFGTQEPLDLRSDAPSDPTEYWIGNDQYPPMDAWILAAILRHLQPRRVIEIGSGFSSLVTARVSREQLDCPADFTCIEPYPRDYLRAGVNGITRLRVEQVQDTPLAVFEDLEANDVLFVDSSHTVKTGNDVTWIFHEILPRLRPGVVVHVHDVFLPHDYPEEWVMEGRGWNENYLVRSFLAFNDTFKVFWASRFMLTYHADVVAEAFPIDPRAHVPAGALWFRRMR